MPTLSLLSHYTLRSLWLRRGTAWAAAAGVALTVFILGASWMLAAGIQETLLRAGRPERALVLQENAFAESDSRLSQNTASLVAAAPGVASDAQGPLVSAECVAHVILSKSDDAKHLATIQIRGVTEAAFRLRPEIRLIDGRMPAPGTDEGIVGSALVAQYKGLHMGEGFELQKGRRVRIVGVFSAERSAFESEVWTDLDQVRTAFGWLGYLSAISVRLNDANAFDAFAAAVKLDKSRGLVPERESTYYTRVSRNLSNMIEGLGSMIGGIFAFGAMLGAAITMYGAVSQRRREIGILLALGFGRSAVLTALVAEAALVAVGGGLFGCALASCTQWLRFSTVNWATSQELVFRFAPHLDILAGSLGLGAALGVLGGFFPALRASRLEPTRAIRGN